MAMSQQADRKNLSPASASEIACWLQRYNHSIGNIAKEQIGRCKYGQNIFDELSEFGITGHGSGHLSIGLPTPAFFEDNSRKILYWCPSDLPSGKSICVASSRLGKKLDTYDSWFDAIRTTAARLNHAEYFFVTGTGTTTDAFLRRIGQLFGFAVLEFQPFPSNLSADWFQECLSDIETEPAKSYRQKRICYFGISEATNTKQNPNQEQFSIDQLLIQIASEVRLLSVRKNGNINRATRQRLAKDPAGETRLLIDGQLTSKPLKDELMTHGATAWWLYHEESTCQSPADESFHAADEGRAIRDSFAAPILDISEIKSDQFLLHWTRRRVGPWPDQTDPEYLDDLIFRSGRRDHAEIATLARILASRRILGTSQLTRARQPVACFSDIPLEEIISRKVFRNHLGRWDCQPFGVAIDRERLLELGARPVVYGNESTWKILDEDDKVFFQLTKTRNNEIDWREENEWRIVGDVDLNLIDTNSAVVFVASPAEAKQVSSISRWPIVVLNS